MAGIERYLMAQVKKCIKPNKVLIIYGARRVGKTQLIRSLLADIPVQDYLIMNGEDAVTERLLQHQSVANYRRLIGNKTLLVIDEAQHIDEIGRKLKLMVDEIEGLSVIVTGSSVFDLSNKLGEPLVGRKSTLHLHPLAQLEMNNHEDLFQTTSRLEDRMLYGGYPELWHMSDARDKEAYLLEMVDSYLLRDILSYEGIRKARKIHDLLRLLAYQVGKEVSVHELANNLQGISRNTVEQYLDLLTKVFVVHPVGGYSQNLRKEVTKNKRWYFYDNGIRNAIIRNFAPLAIRNDVGELWENYLIAERIKYQGSTESSAKNHYWRTYDQQEIDWVEREGDQLRAYEFKWSMKKKVKVPKAWSVNYPEASFEIIHQDNYLDWISPVV